MRNRKRVSSLKTAVALLGACAVAVWCAGAMAQAGGGGGFRSLEKNPKVWEEQAKCVAQGLGLAAEQTTKLVDAYKAARESYIAAIQAKMPAEGRPDMAAMMEVTKAERGKLETALKGFLKPEEATKALATLGTFSRRWDPMVVALDGMKLDEKAMGEAMKLVAGYVAESGAALEAAMASGDRESVREKMTTLREKLDADLAKVLSADQVTTWKEATPMGGRGGRGGGGGRGGRPEGPPPPPPAPPATPAAK